MELLNRNLRKTWETCLGTAGFGWLSAAVLINGILILYTALHTLQAFSLSPDEYAYNISAQLFSTGRLSIPSPQPHLFFDTLNVMNQGTYYGKYPPGWPLLLSLGIKTGLAWLVNPLCGLLALVTLFILARELFSPLLANISMALTFASPYFIFNSACFLAHASCMLFLTLAAYLCLISKGKFQQFLGLGALAGFAFLIRPFTAILFMAPLTLTVLVLAIHRRESSTTKGLLFGAFPVFVFFISLYLLYNQAQTGRAFLQPFEAYNIQDRLGFFHHTLREYWDRFNYNIFERSWDWVVWTAGTPLLVLFFAIRGQVRSRAYHLGLLLASPALALLIGYYFYLGPGPFQYGPRYLYESFALMLIPAAMGLLAFRRWTPVILVIIIVLNGSMFIRKTMTYQRMAEDHIQFFKHARQLSNAVIFIHASDYESSAYFTRNGLDFNGPTLLVLDLGKENNQKFMKRYPGRAFYICDFDTSKGQPLFKPYTKQFGPLKNLIVSP